MDVIVPDDQLSLAIGRRGQNVRLAVQLTGWKIDMKSESKMREIAHWLSEAVSVVESCGDPEAELLLQQGIMSLEDLSECAIDLLTALPGIDERGAAAIQARALELIGRKRQEEEERDRLEAEEALRRSQEAAAAAALATATAEAEASAAEAGGAEAPTSSEDASGAEAAKDSEARE
jgi:N utilization substance protein A